MGSQRNTAAHTHTHTHTERDRDRDRDTQTHRSHVRECGTAQRAPTRSYIGDVVGNTWLVSERPAQDVHHLRQQRLVDDGEPEAKQLAHSPCCGVAHSDAGLTPHSLSSSICSGDGQAVQQHRQHLQRLQERQEYEQP